MKLTTSSLREYLQEQSLESLAETLQTALKKHPSNLETRYALATLWCLEESWDKALLQADTLIKIADAPSSQGELLKNLILSEMVRKEVLTGSREPRLLDDVAPTWFTPLRQANLASHSHKHERADELREEAFKIAPLSAGYSDKQGEFDWISDGDGRLGPVCEFICAGGYRWVPFSQMLSLSISVPQTLLDLLWIPAILDTGARKWNGYLPARYPQSTAFSPRIKLGDETHWNQQSEYLTTGTGRKMWLTDRGEFSILEGGKMTFRKPEHP